MSKICAALIIVAILSIPVLLLILLIRALMRKPLKVVAIVLAVCVGSILPLTIVGVATDPSTPQRFEDALNSLESKDTVTIVDDTATPTDTDTERVDEEDVETKENDVETVETLSVPNDAEKTNEEPSKKCEPGKKFVFQFQGSTATSYVKEFCEHPGHFYLRSIFRGTPTDLSYLEVIRDHSDSDEILWGEYYTITATVAVADYDFNRTRIRCEVQNDKRIVNFSVEFRGEFEEAVDPIKEGDTITFRGRFYDEGCGFTDCELITE